MTYDGIWVYMGDGKNLDYRNTTCVTAFFTQQDHVVFNKFECNDLNLDRQLQMAYKTQHSNYEHSASIRAAL